MRPIPCNAFDLVATAGYTCTGHIQQRRQVRGDSAIVHQSRQRIRVRPTLLRSGSQ